MSLLFKIAQNIAEKVSEIQFNGEKITATVDLAPELDMYKLKERSVFVTPQIYTRSNISRSESAVVAKLNIAVCERITTDELDSRIELVETIASTLERSVLQQKDLLAVVSSVEFDPVYDAESLLTKRCFVSICSVTVKVLK